MAVNPLNKKQLERLWKAVDWSNRQLRYTRRKRVEALYHYVGSHFSDRTTRRRVPVNFLKLAVDIYSRALSPHAPRCLMRTVNPNMLSIALDMEYAVNQIPAEINLSQTFRRWVVEALFSMGILKIGLKEAGSMLGIPYGKTFVDNVTMDDYFIDMSAKHRPAIQYEGNDYWMDYEELMEAEWVDRESRKFLKPDEERTHDKEGQMRAERLQQQETAETFRDRIWLQDIWLPKERQLITRAVTSDRKVNIVDYDAPTEGPYIKLGFSDVPGNLLPLAPVQVWRDLHELGNSVFRKLGTQADGEKSVLGFGEGSSEDVESFKSAQDGDGIAYHGGKPEKLTAGGVNTNTLGFYLQIRDLQSYFAGNLDSLGGLAQLTETVGQDKLLSESASAQLRDMSALTIDASREVFQALAYHEWSDPVRVRTIDKEIPGTTISLPVQLTPEMKQGDFEDLEVEIDIYSLQESSPSVRLQKLGAVTQQYVLPLAPIIEAQGGTVDVKKLLDYVARYSDMPEIREIVSFAGGYGMDPQRQAQRSTQRATAPPNQPREYIHRSPGPSREGAANALVQQLIGPMSQPEG